MEFLSQEQMRANLEELKSNVDQKRNELTANKFARDNSGEAARQDSLTSVLKMIASMGVDFSSPESVQQFLAELEQNSPDLFELFNDAMNGLLGEEAPMPGMPVGLPEEQMNNEYENPTPDQGLPLEGAS